MALPGPQASTLGIVGDGHLARQLAAAARELGVLPRLIPVRDVAALLDDPSRGGVRARAIVEGCAVLTLATEHCPAAALRLLGRHGVLHPSPDVAALAQDRWEERQWFEALGIRTPDSRRVGAPGALHDALRDLGGEAYLKPCRRAHDEGRPVYVRRSEHALEAWGAFGSVPLVVEEVVPIDLELGVLVARARSGEVVVYPPVLNQRQATHLRWSVMPAPLAPEVAERAMAWARQAAEGLGLVGTATLELFCLKDGRLLVNEVVVGPHMAHAGDDAAYRAGQCAQQVRAVMGLPLASATPLRPTATAPITGDLWSGGRVPDFEPARSLGGVRVSFYADGPPTGGRILGHISASAETTEAAVSLLLAAQRHLAAGPDRPRLSRTADAGPTT